jgi:pyruvate dehydrogenase E2 component (dihydrolipoamide acetyltransferase)
MTTAQLTQVHVPDIGDFGEVPVIEVLVAVGDTVAVEDPLVTLESDKATMDVPAPLAGVVKAIHVSVGDTVAEGKLLLDLEPADAGAGAAGSEAADASVNAEDAASPSSTEAAAPEPPDAAEAGDHAPHAPVGAAVTAPVSGAPSTGNGQVYASPSVRRIARELNVDLSTVAGSGRKGRIIPDDVRSAGSTPAAPAQGGPAHAATSGGTGLDLAPWPVVDFEKFGPVERVERSRIQKISARYLARNWAMIPHVTQNDDADITDLEAWRKQLNKELERDGVKVTMVTFLVVASVAALKAFPAFNSALDGDELVLRKYYNIGFAADTPDGLVVPVIKDADRKGIVEIARDLTELSGKARAGKLSRDEMSGATFTISSLGGIGGTSFTPIINAPEVAILGATRSAVRPIWDEAAAAFQPRLILPLSLSYDHRVIDGAAAARFTVHLTRVLSDLRRALL